MSNEPLANKIRPKSLEEFIGQKHLTAKNAPLGLATSQKHLFSFILWGSAGVGKTTLSRIYAKAMDAEYFELSAVSAGKDDIKKIVELENSLFSKQKILFLDEIHRFSKSQQDFLLPFVESGKLVLIGATTQNPSFEVIPALLSRCQVFVLNPLNEAEMNEVINRTKTTIEEKARKWLIELAEGDARKAITIIENTAKLYKEITLESLQNTLQTKLLKYDKTADEHYNTISAFIKSMRASQPDAALYYLARMVEVGEDPLFIARRMVIFASEDVGMGDVQALTLANSVFQACQSIGYPECAINLAHGATYLSLCKKDRRAYNGIKMARNDVKTFGGLPIPLKILNAPTKLMENLGYGEGYEKYDKEEYLPEKLKGTKYFKE